VPTTAADEVVRQALEAQGGLESWQRVAFVTATVDLNGVVWEAKTRDHPLPRYASRSRQATNGRRSLRSASASDGPSKVGRAHQSGRGLLSPYWGTTRQRPAQNRVRSKDPDHRSSSDGEPRESLIINGQSSDTQPKPRLRRPDAVARTSRAVRAC